MKTKQEKKPEYYEPSYGERPLMFFKDRDGNGWLCDKDKDIDPDKDLREQGCWRCDEMAFPTGGR
jgi:hypothetical protein